MLKRIQSEIQTLYIDFRVKTVTEKMMQKEMKESL